MYGSKIKTGNRGLALVGILLMLTVLGMLAVLMAGLGSQNQRLAGAQTQSEVALNAAEAGLAVALEKYIRDSEYQGNSVPESFGSIGQTYQVTLYTETSPPPDGTVVPPDHTLLVSKGLAQSGVSRQVAAMVTEQIETDSHDNALLAGEKVFVSGQAQIASLTSGMVKASSLSKSSSSSSSSKSTSISLSIKGISVSFSLKSGSLNLSVKEGEKSLYSFNREAAAVEDSSSTSIEPSSAAPAEQEVMKLDGAAAGTQGDGGSNAHIAVAGDGQDALTLESGAVVDGELRIPGGADEGTVVQDDGAIHGGVNGYNPPALVPVRLPLVPGDQDIDWTASSSPSSYGGSFSGNELEPGAYGDVVVDGGTLELNTQDLGSGDKDLYVFRSLTLKNGGKIILKGDAEANNVTSGLYIDEKFEVQDGSLLNETSDPSRLQVYISDGAPVTLDFDEPATAMLYAPGSVVTMDEGELNGNIVGKEVYLNDGAVVNYDSSLAGVSPDPWGNGGFYAFKKSYRRR